jgi:SAM-dependent methyltransferase
MYWDNRYKKLSNNGNVLYGSGMGSVGEAVTKRIALLKKHCTDIKSVLDVGCGDLNVGFDIMELYPDAYYLGLDSSRYLIEALRRQYNYVNLRYINNSEFYYPSDLVVCFDVLYHIMDDEDYERMLKSLKDSWKKYLVIITDNKDGNDKDEGSDYMKKRIFDPKYFSDKYETETDISCKEEADGSSIIMYIFKK